jgi:DNA-binding GntR family transcriptional regulator
MVKRDGGESLAVGAYEQLRADIYDRRLTPGERLKPAELGTRLGVSIGVMREALGLLAAQELVTVERNRGYHVVSLSAAALDELIEARKITEGAALRLSIERGGVTWESEVLAAHHRMASVPGYLPDQPSARNPEWARHHIAFHQTLIEACGNPRLLDICARLSDSAELYRAWSGAGGSPHRDLEVEHRALMEAALAHDADLAVQLFEAHLERTRAIVLDLERASAPSSHAGDLASGSPNATL